MRNITSSVEYFETAVNASELVEGYVIAARARLVVRSSLDTFDTYFLDR